MNFSFSSSIPDKSESKSRLGTRKGSISIHNESFIGSSSNYASKKPVTNHLSTNYNSSNFFNETQFQEPEQTGPKRIIISQEVKAKVFEQFYKKLDALSNNQKKPPKTNYNVRVSLIKRLEETHFKTHMANKWIKTLPKPIIMLFMHL